MAGKNYENLMELVKEKHQSFIVYDVETTGVMDGLDNRITQLALCAYQYNEASQSYELQDKLFMLAKAEEGVLLELEAMRQVNDDVINRRLEKQFDYDTAKGKTNLTFQEYAEVNYEKVRSEIENTPPLRETLSSQGIDMERWIRTGEGLETSEMQVGVNAFLKKYESDVYITNGTRFAEHYLNKQKMSLFTDNKTVIDMVQVQRSIKGGKSRWTTDVTTFADQYYNDTGKRIKIFDALTKALCYSEMIGKAVEISVKQNTLSYVENMVKESAMNNDDNYVMSLSTMMSRHWELSDAVRGTYNFSSLEYVDFGNDRRYVDLDMMFEVNDNFEITLEGDKTPIKSWDELENKIKALNANISEELLTHIKEKFEEVQKEVEAVKPKEEVQELADKDVFYNLQADFGERLKAFEALADALEEEHQELVKDYSRLRVRGVRLSEIDSFSETFRLISSKTLLFDLGIYGLSEHTELPYEIDFLKGYLSYKGKDEPIVNLENIPDSDWAKIKSGITMCLEHKMDDVINQKVSANEELKVNTTALKKRFWTEGKTEVDRDLFNKVSKLHDYLFDAMGLDDMYDKYAKEDAVYGIYDDVRSGKDIRKAFDDVFNMVYDYEIESKDFDKFYKKAFKDNEREEGER